MIMVENIIKIEGYDVSHFSSDSAVASCVVFSKQGPEKKNYRLFNIPTELSGNDIGSLEHVIHRRIKYYADSELKPDVILIDGRFRVASFLFSLMNAKEDSVIIFDDYMNRPHYHVVEEILEVYEYFGRQVIFKVPKVFNIQLAKELLQKFTYVFD